jgi:O-acetyl-ADP-ribose deacetylase (regulator of RNase III)
MVQIFINFRTLDSAGFATLLDCHLTDQFGAGAVFLSPRSILPGADFVAAIPRTLQDCTVLLAVIGPGWLSYGSVRRAARVTALPDWVRWEIAEALRAGIRVIPILVAGARMPAEEDLPSDIAALARCQLLNLNQATAREDLRRIADAVVSHLPPADRNPQGQRITVAAARPEFELAAPACSACRVTTSTGSILQVTSAAIWVNSENTDMNMARHNEFSVSAIIRYWGAQRDDAGLVVNDVIRQQLHQKVGERTRVSPGSTFVTEAGSLAQTNGVAYIIHVAAVEGEPGLGYHQVRDIRRCITSVLTEADRLAARTPAQTLLIPLLGTGIAGADVAATATATVHAAADFLVRSPETPLRSISFLAYTEAERDALDSALTSTPRLTPTALNSSERRAS